MFVSTILFTAFPPPPPTPRTLITHGLALPSGIIISLSVRGGTLKLDSNPDEVSSADPLS
jgi:hypothetical protein